MNRYSKYFLQHSLWLDDGFCQYYVQDDTWGRQDILDVELVIFDWTDDADQWIAQCRAYDQSTTLRRLRTFLADHCREPLNLHRMTDRQVMRAAARQVCRYAHPVVINPRMGWAVQVDANSAAPVLPISVEPEPELTGLMAELKVALDALVVEQQKKYDRYEAQLAKLSPEQQALLYSQKAGGAIYDSAVGDTWQMLKAAPGAIWKAAKAFPGFYAGYLKGLWKVAQLPSQMAVLTSHAIATGNYNPLKEEIDQIVTPVAQTYEQALKYKSMLTLLFGDQETYTLLHDFAQRYWAATHPIERTQMAASAVSDIVVTVILAIVTAGVGAAANVATKSGKLVKVAKLLEKIAMTIKKISPESKLVDKAKDAAGKLRKTEKRTAKAAREMKHAESEIKTARRVENLEKETHTEYAAAKEVDGPKKTDIKTRKDFKNPEEAYRHVRNLDGDIAQIKKRNLNISKTDVDMTKKNVREWFPEDEYPGIDYSKIDKKLDQYTGKAFDEKELKGVKDYLFDNSKFKPPKNAADELNGPFYDNAESWARLAEGKGNHADDILIKHEILETRLKYDMGLEDLGKKAGKKWFETHSDCHGVAEEIYNYSEAIKGIK